MLVNFTSHPSGKDTPQTNCCVTEYGFCVEFVTYMICVQCALKSHVRPQC